MNPDFYIPYEGGVLPMKVLRVEVQEEGSEMGGLREVTMKIEAVSVGAPEKARPEMPILPEIGS